MTQTISISEFFQLNEPIPIIDVRTPAEFEKGHIPGAFNVPLFNNEERIQVGTTYKKHSREVAILMGFDLAGPKWSGFIKDCLEIAPDKKIAVHCWRGGMRSGAMAWALDLYGFKVHVIQGGYKKYRVWVRQQFEIPYHLKILGGMTGSGKTYLLEEMKKIGQQVVDLEALACHRGSAYGSMNKMIAPTQEQFENNLARALYQMDTNEAIWMEDECRLIGRCSIPAPLWQQMRDARLFNWQVPLEKRLHFLVAEYGGLDKEFLITSTQRISKRLGPRETKEAIIAIKEDRMADFIRIVLVYYDKTYRKGLENRPAENILEIQTSGKSLAADATEIIQHFTSTTTLLQPNITTS